MDFVILSYGGGEFLHAMLQGASDFCASDSFFQLLLFFAVLSLVMVIGKAPLTPSEAQQFAGRARQQAAAQAARVQAQQKTVASASNTAAQSAESNAKNASAANGGATKQKRATTASTANGQTQQQAQANAQRQAQARAAQAGNNAFIGYLAKQSFINPILLFALTWGLSAALVLPKVNIIVDDTIETGKFYTAESVPLGLALPAVIVSTVGDLITSLFEECFTLISPHLSDPGLSYRQTGFLFAHKLLVNQSKITIIDPILRENLAQFFDQCVYTDLINERYQYNQLIQSTDPLGFIHNHANPNNVYRYRDYGSSGNYFHFTCGAALSPPNPVDDFDSAGPIMKDLLYESKALTKRLFAKNGLKDLAYEDYLAQVGNIYSYLLDASASGSQAMQQSVFSDALNEGLGRYAAQNDLHAATISYGKNTASKERQYSAKSIGELSSEFLPLMYNCLLGIAYGFFPIVLASLLLPAGAGIALFAIYMKILIWLPLWRAFYAVLHYFTIIWSAQLGAPIADLYNDQGSSGGVTFAAMTHLYDYLHEHMYIAYALMPSVPIITWMIVNVGSHSFGGFINGIFRHDDRPVQVASTRATLGNVKMGTVSIDKTRAFKTNTSPLNDQRSLTVDHGNFLSRTWAGAKGEENIEVTRANNYGTEVRLVETNAYIHKQQMQMLETYKQQAMEQYFTAVEEYNKNLEGLNTAIWQSENSSDMLKDQRILETGLLLRKREDMFNHFSGGTGITTEKLGLLYDGARLTLGHTLKNKLGKISASASIERDDIAEAVLSLTGQEISEDDLEDMYNYLVGGAGGEMIDIAPINYETQDEFEYELFLKKLLRVATTGSYKQIGEKIDRNVSELLTGNQYSQLKEYIDKGSANYEEATKHFTTVNRIQAHQAQLAQTEQSSQTHNTAYRDDMTQPVLNYMQTQMIAPAEMAMLEKMGIVDGDQYWDRNTTDRLMLQIMRGEQSGTAQRLLMKYSEQYMHSLYGEAFNYDVQGPSRPSATNTLGPMAVLAEYDAAFASREAGRLKFIQGVLAETEDLPELRAAFMDNFALTMAQDHRATGVQNFEMKQMLGQIYIDAMPEIGRRMYAMGITPIQMPGLPGPNSPVETQPQIDMPKFNHFLTSYAQDNGFDWVTISDLAAMNKLEEALEIWHSDPDIRKEMDDEEKALYQEMYDAGIPVRIYDPDNGALGSSLINPATMAWVKAKEAGANSEPSTLDRFKAGSNVRMEELYDEDQMAIYNQMKTFYTRIGKHPELVKQFDGSPDLLVELLIKQRQEVQNNFPTIYNPDAEVNLDLKARK